MLKKYFHSLPCYLIRPLLIICVVCLSLCPIHAQNKWTLKQEKDGIILYQPETSQGTLQYYKAIFTVDASLKECASILYYHQFHPFFMDGIKSSELIKSGNDTSLYFYHIIDLPWPLSNRDMVTHALFAVSPDNKKVTVKLKSAPEEKAPTSMTRVILPEREWHFVKTDSGDTQVTYYYKSDTDKLPAFLEELISIDGPMKMMARFRKLLDSNRQQLPRLAWMEE